MTEKILKPYSVEINIVTVVMATDSTHAMQVAEETARDALYDTMDYDYGTGRAITEEKQLAAIGWDGECVPYGGDGETRLSEIIAALPPPRDTKTIDMFQEQQS